MFIQIIKLKSNLSEEELLRRAREREPQFKVIPEAYEIVEPPNIEILDVLFQL